MVMKIQISFFQNLLNHVYERHFEYSLPVSIIFARNSEMKEKLNVKQRERLKVLLLSYSRSGSSLLGELLSLHPSTSYYFEPFWKYDLPCSQRHNSSSVVQFLEDILRKGLINTESNKMDLLQKTSSDEISS